MHGFNGIERVEGSDISAAFSAICTYCKGFQGNKQLMLWKSAVSECNRRLTHMPVEGRQAVTVR